MGNIYFQVASECLQQGIYFQICNVMTNLFLK